MDRAVSSAELKAARGHLGKQNCSRVFYTGAPNKGIHVASDPIIFMDHIVRHPELRPTMTFADLGSGAGRICFTAAHHFAQVVGYEKDATLFGEAQNIQQELGFENVRFECANFLKADLTGHDVLYVYHPFFNNFATKMIELVDNNRQVRPGTFITSNITYELARLIFERGGKFEPFLAEGVSASDARYQIMTVYRKN